MSIVCCFYSTFLHAYFSCHVDANNTSPVKPGIVPCECESGEEEHISIVYKEMKVSIAAQSKVKLLKAA